MNELLSQLLAGAASWRGKGIDEYWLHVAYVGGDLDRFGEHDLTLVEDELWHSKDGGKWKTLSNGSIYWVFSVPGTFVWVRDMLTKVLPEQGAGPDSVTLRMNDEHGYVEYLKVQVAKRAADNFTLEIQDFGLGEHPNWRP
jgi:hypothetical protein